MPKLLRIVTIASLIAILTQVQQVKAATFVGTLPSTVTGVNDLDIGIGTIDVEFVDIAGGSFNDAFGAGAYNTLGIGIDSEGLSNAIAAALGILATDEGGFKSYGDNIAYVVSYAASTTQLSYHTVFTNPLNSGANGPFTASRTLTSWVSSASFVTASGFTPIEAVPLPTALPLLATAFGFLGFMGWRRRAA